jgi:prophage antirepressor-like protein
MNQLTIFTNPEFGTIRTMEINGEVWLVGKDVAEILGYSNTRDALARHVDAEDKNTVVIPDGNKGNPNQTIINESGLYSLILSSKLPTAKKFKHWVTSEVLPAIRKTGSYTVETKPDDKLLTIELTKVQNERAKILMQLADTETLSQDWKNIIVSKTVEILTGEKLLPLPESEKTYSATEIGEIFGVSAQKIGRIANANGMKTSEYGKFYKDKSPYCSKEVDTFRYNGKAIDKFKQILS